LRDGNGNPQSTDGGYALDPTHPGTRTNINFYINEFTNWGFDYVKLDFLSQEFNREANTLCSKSNAVDLTAIGLDLKAVIDQFREQVQNLE